MVRVVFMGTPDFAIPALKRLIEMDVELVGVVTQPDKPAGRGYKLTPPPVKTFAEKHGVDVFQPKSLKGDGAVQSIRDLKPDVVAVSAYGKLIPKSILDIPLLGTLNIHPSMLPKYRGAAPIQRAIMNGDRKTGVTIMLIDEGLDSGPLVRQEEVEILDDDDAISLSNILGALGAELLVDVLTEAGQTGKIASSPQDEAQVVMAPKIEREEGAIDWENENERIICQIRALVQWPSAYTFYQGKRLKIFRAEPADTELNLESPKLRDIQPGTIIEMQKGKGPIVKTGDGALLLKEIQLEGRSRLSGSDAVNGSVLSLGKMLDSE